ncbi:hypothetical protein B0H10DRAFT_2325313 [Mycena sp. CBHHK59/15]|nr:hypothetical protein B0H10DRAFT_2325313 [Mycena sp. CBHHK59/15]
MRLLVTCPAQVDPIAPALAFAPQATETYQVRLQGAIRVRTETFDGASTDGSGASPVSCTWPTLMSANPWYDKFYAFKAYLKEMYPQVFASLTLEHFATHGLLLTWQGSDSSLQPISAAIPFKPPQFSTHPIAAQSSWH